MKIKNDDLEDLVCYLECARDSLLVIHDSLEGGIINPQVLMSSVYSTYIQLNWIAEAMQKQLNKIPTAVIRNAAKEVAS